MAIATLEKSLSHQSDACAPWGEPEHLEHGPIVQRTPKKSKGFFPLIGTLSSASEKHEHGIGVAGLQPTSHTPSNLLKTLFNIYAILMKSILTRTHKKQLEFYFLSEEVVAVSRISP